jgi:hypothetical protein
MPTFDEHLGEARRRGRDVLELIGGASSSTRVALVHTSRPGAPLGRASWVIQHPSLRDLRPGSQVEIHLSSPQGRTPPGEFDRDGRPRPSGPGRLNGRTIRGRIGPGGVLIAHDIGQDIREALSDRVRPVSGITITGRGFEPICIDVPGRSTDGASNPQRASFDFIRRHTQGNYQRLYQGGVDMDNCAHGNGSLDDCDPSTIGTKALPPPGRQPPRTFQPDNRGGGVLRLW